jgi:hypothetical protein
MRRLLPLALLLLPSLGQAQNFGNIKPGSVIGNPDATASKPAAPMSAAIQLDVRQWGAVCDGTADDTAALQAAAAASGIGNVGQVALPVGKTCKFNQQIQFANTNSPGFTCATPGYCTLDWTGPATVNPILFASNTGPFGATEIVKINGGTGYTAGSVVTLNDSCATHAVVTIAAVAAGVPTDARITTLGSCAAKPALNVAQLSATGGGTGATFDMSYGSLATQINYPTLDGVVLTSSTTMTGNAFVRFDFTYQGLIKDTRLYGAAKMWQGVVLSRAQYFNVYDTRLDHLLDQGILVSGTDPSLHGNVGTHLRNVIFAACNEAAGTKAVAQSKGCLRIGDYVGGIFLDDKVEVFSHRGYGVYFGPTLGHTGGNNLSSLAYFNGLNVEASGVYAGAIGGGNWTGLTIGGPGSWLTGNNMDAIGFSSGTMNDVRLDSQVYVSQSDASNPAAVNFNGTLLQITGSEIGGYTTGTTAINLGTGAGQVFITGTKVQNAAVGIAGTAGTGGSKTMSNVNFSGMTTGDFSGIGCKDFIIATGTATTGGMICPSSKIVDFTRDLSLASGSQALTGFGFKPTRCSSFGSIDLVTGSYTTFNGRTDATGGSSALAYYAAGQMIKASGVFLYGGSGADNAQAAVASYDADGLTLNWTKNGAATGTFKFAVECERG